MTPISRLITGLSIITVIVLSGCKDSCETQHTYTFFEPVYITLNEVRSGFQVTDPQPITNLGKIYLYGSTMLVNEVGEGVHIINNADPGNPIILKFIKIPGNFDIAVKDNVLFADSYIDLLSIDISDIDQIKLIHREENAFPGYNTQFGFTADQGNVITSWVEKETVEITKDCRYSGAVISLGFGVAMDAASSFESSIGGPVGMGGSMARFAIQKQFLYAVDSYEMHIFDISNSALPQKSNSIGIGWEVETIFPYKDKIFIGTRSGMFIYDSQIPGDPQFLSEFIHATACDPVVANDNYAFVTLRSGTPCEGFVNELNIIDIENIANPVLLKKIPMNNPHGLGLDGNTLFICEGEFGLKIYDISDIDRPALIKNVINIQVHDVIAWQGILIAIGEEGVYQYDYSNLDEISLLSFIQFDSK